MKTKKHTERAQLTQQNPEYFAKEKKRQDLHMWVILSFYYLFGIGISFKYDTWLIGLGVGSLIIASVLVAYKFLPKSNLYQYVFSAAVGLYMAQFIYQMHGMFEMHFFAFIGSSVLITFRKWQLQIVVAAVVVVHHSAFALMQYNYGYQDIFFTQLTYMDLETFIFHASLAAAMFGISGFWSYKIDSDVIEMLKMNSSLMEKDKMENIMKTVESVAVSLNSSSVTSHQSVQNMSSQINSTASSLEEVSAAIEEMLSTIEMSSENSKNAVVTSQQIESIIRQNDENIHLSIKSMQEIARKISVVEEIARQTNMLALNAAVEAARAGESGKGFAVVASEIRKLAARSHDAANEINALSSRSTEITEKLSKSVVEILPNFQAVHDKIAQISEALNQQEKSTAQISDSITYINDATQSSANEFESISQISDDIANKSTELQRLFKADQAA